MPKIFWPVDREEQKVFTEKTGLVGLFK